MEMGLAESMTQQATGIDAMVQEVVQLLLQGVDPEELVRQGVPIEVVHQAVEIILAQEQQSANMATAPSTDVGLAMTAGGMQY